MASIICGKHGDFFGSQETIFKAYDNIRHAIKMCEDKTTKKNFIKELKKNPDKRAKYKSAFSLIKMLQDLNDEQKKCYNLLQKYLK